ncbi:MAG: MoxR family ATPase [Planctomycetes bacterium]|nr:MoxR family ATPase [Planctomycetota bacterium]
MQTARERARAIESNVRRVVRGGESAIRLAVISLLIRGHLLIEDVPGTGKTVLARALARSLDARFGRIQCTQDLLPTDITGVSIFDPQALNFRFQEGPVFTDVLLADEINRATPRAQSALLECMEERQVTCDGVRHALPSGFLVLATQNPIDMEGTFPLPEAQLDRFALSTSLGYPDDEVLVQILEDQRGAHPIDALQPVADLAQLVAAQQAVTQVRCDRGLLRYVAQLTRATREAEGVQLGASPRAALFLVRAARAWALLEARDFVLPDDVHAVAHAVLDHRVLVDPRSRLGGRTPKTVVDEVLGKVPVPLVPQDAPPE